MENKRKEIFKGECVRIYPNKRQKEFIDANINAAKVAYNTFLYRNNLEMRTNNNIKRIELLYEEKFDINEFRKKPKEEKEKIGNTLRIINSLYGVKFPKMSKRELEKKSGTYEVEKMYEYLYNMMVDLYEEKIQNEQEKFDIELVKKSYHQVFVEKISNMKFYWSMFEKILKEERKNLNDIRSYISTKIKFPKMTEKNLKDGTAIILDPYNFEEVPFNEYKWWKDCDSRAPVAANRALFDAWNKFFTSVKKGNYSVGKPRYKKKEAGGTYESGKSAKVDFENKKIRIPKIGEWVKFRTRKNIKGDVRTIWFKKDKDNTYHAIIRLKSKVSEFKKTGKSIGIDVGIRKYLVGDNGFSVESPKFLEQEEQKLAKAQKVLSRRGVKVKNENTGKIELTGSNREKARIKVAKLHKSIAAKRKAFQHKLAFDLIKNYDVIYVENLSVKKMIENKREKRKENRETERKIHKQIADAGWGNFIAMLKYKAEWRGKEVIEIGRYYPSTKMCSRCGTYHPDFDQVASKYVFTCTECGYTGDVDFNAAKNIRNWTPEKEKEFEKIIK